MNEEEETIQKITAAKKMLIHMLATWGDLIIVGEDILADCDAVGTPDWNTVQELRRIIKKARGYRE